MTNQDFERAFGSAPQGFEDAIRRGLREDRRRTAIKTSRRALLIAALIAVLMFGVAFAATNGFGLLNLLSQRFQTPDAAQEWVQTPAPQQSNPLDRIAATLEQAITDGEKVYFTVRIAPKPGEKLLLMNDMDDSPGARFPLSDDSNPVTFREVAEREGKQLLVAVPGAAWTGDCKTYRGEIIGEKRDGDAVVHARAVDCLPDEDGKVRLSVEVRVYSPDDPSPTKQTTTLTATLENTGELKAYRWKNPAKMKALGIQLTEVRITDSAMTRSVEVRYKPLKGHEQEYAKADWYRWLEFFDEQGKLIPAVFGGTMDKKGDTYVQWTALPATSSDSFIIGTRIESDDWENVSGENLVRLNLQNAEKVDIESILEKRRAKLSAEAEKSAKASADYEREASATPKPRPTAMPAVSATGCEIPLLRNYDTAYAGVRDQLEAIAMPVNQTVKGKSAALTIDQLVMSDKQILVFYSIKSKNKILRGGEVSLGGSGVDKVPYFDITFDGENPMATERSFTASFGSNQQFWLDDYNEVGWTRGSCWGAPGESVPEKGWLTIKARQFGGGLTLDLAMDRTPSLERVAELDLDAFIPMKDHTDLGLTLKHLSMSPAMNTLWTEEDEIGGGGQALLIRDDRGKSLTVAHQYSPSVDAAPDRPKRVTGLVEFVGGLDSKALTLVPIEPAMPDEDAGRSVVLVPVDAPLPYTVQHGPGVMTVIHEISLTTTGMAVRYKTDLPDGINNMGFVKSEQGEIYEDEPSIRVEPTPKLDCATGIWTFSANWVPQKGAKEGERVPAALIDGLKFLRFDGAEWAADEDRAVVVPLRN